MHHNSDVAYRRSLGQFAFQKLEIHLDPSSLLFVVFLSYFFDFLSYEGIYCTGGHFDPQLKLGKVKAAWLNQLTK